VVAVLITVEYVVVVAAMALLYLQNAVEVRLKKNQVIHRQVIHHQVIHRKDVLGERNHQIHIAQQQVTLLQEDFLLQARRKIRRRNYL
jgi:hypothetical protein